MTQQSIRKDFHSFVAENLANDIFYRRSNYYYFLGKVDRWGTEDTPPATPINQSQAVDDQIRGNMLYLKKISPSDATLVIKRYKWEHGVVYEQWDHTKDMSDYPFYCVTSEFNVYKCLNNNNGVPSTEEPIGQSFFPITTADGYIWKYMYNIPAFKRSKFSSVEYMPVQKALSDSFYNDGAIDEVTVTSSGEGYSDIQRTLIQVDGITTGSGATAELVLGPLGEITSVNIIDGGVDYIKGVKIDLVSGTGSGAKLTPVIESGVITEVTVDSAGIGYKATDSISFRVGGAILVPHISRTSGSIEAVSIVDGGAGFVVAPTLTVYDSEGVVAGSGKYGNPSAILTAVEYEGSIVNITVEDPGVNYRFDTNTQIVVQGDGEDAKFSPVVYNGRLIDVIIENRGKNYTFATLNVVGTGAGATVVAGVSASDFTSNQAVVEQTTVAGAIYSIVVTEQGENYSPFTTKVTVSGNGVGCVASPVIIDGKISAISISNFGSGYNYASVTITDPSRSTNLGFKDAKAYAILTPSNGHGFDAPKELCANTVAINTTLVRSGELSFVEQDFRSFGILRNPNRLNSLKLFDADTELAAYSVTLESTADLVIDETLVNGLNRYKVVAIESETKVLLQQIGESLTLPSGYFVPSLNDGRSYRIIKIESAPKINRFSGDLLYVSYENPFTFTEGQIVTVKTFIRL